MKLENHIGGFNCTAPIVSAIRLPSTLAGRSCAFTRTAEFPAQSKDKRPEFDGLHKAAARREFDVVMAGRSIVSAAAFKTWSASFRKSMPLASTCSCTSTASTPRRRAERRRFRRSACCLSSSARSYRNGCAPGLRRAVSKGKQLDLPRIAADTEARYEGCSLAIGNKPRPCPAPGFLFLAPMTTKIHKLL